MVRMAENSKSRLKILTTKTLEVEMMTVKTSLQNRIRVRIAVRHRKDEDE